MSTINWLVVLMPVYGERNGLHLAPLLWESLKIVEQEIFDGAEDKLVEISRCEWQECQFLWGGIMWVPLFYKL